MKVTFRKRAKSNYTIARFKELSYYAGLRSELLVKHLHIEELQAKWNFLNVS
jgi:hypothetical protein